MKLLTICFLAAVCLFQVSAVTSAQSDQSSLTGEERAGLLVLLGETESELSALVADLTEEQWRYRPGFGRWTIAEIVEHIALTEQALFSTVKTALAQKPNPDWESKTQGKGELLGKLLPSRVRRAQAPLEVRPTGKMTLSDALARFRQIRATVKRFSEETDQRLKAHTLDHPFPVFGTLSAHQWLLYIPLHNGRHNQQIAEVKSSPGFPK